MSLCRLISPSFPLTQHWRWIFARDYVSISYNFNKKFTLFCSIGDFSVCPLVFALLVLPVRFLPPATLPSDLGTTTRESPRPQVLEGRPRCIGRDFDEISQAAWLVPPWTSRAAYESSQTFCHPFLPMLTHQSPAVQKRYMYSLDTTRFGQTSHKARLAGQWIAVPH